VFLLCRCRSYWEARSRRASLAYIGIGKNGLESRAYNHGTRVQEAGGGDFGDGQVANMNVDSSLFLSSSRPQSFSACIYTYHGYRSATCIIIFLNLTTWRCEPHRYCAVFVFVFWNSERSNGAIDSIRLVNHTINACLTPSAYQSWSVLDSHSLKSMDLHERESTSLLAIPASPQSRAPQIGESTRITERDSPVAKVSSLATWHRRQDLVGVVFSLGRVKDEHKFFGETFSLYYV